MWKSAFLSRDTMKYYPQTNVKKIIFSTESVEKRRRDTFSTGYLFTIHSGCA